MKRYKIVFKDGNFAHLVCSERREAINTYKRLNLTNTDIQLVEEVYELKEENVIDGNV
jgi:hypothetical protein